MELTHIFEITLSFKLWFQEKKFAVDLVKPRGVYLRESERETERERQRQTERKRERGGGGGGLEYRKDDLKTDLGKTQIDHN